MNASLATMLWSGAAASKVKKLLLVVVGTAALAISAKVQVPFWPVPMTMQTLVVLLIGATYGAALGGMTLGAYLAQGAFGLPVFATGAGLSYIAGPTGGYLAGFLLAAVVVGTLTDRGYGRTIATAFAVVLIGAVIIYAGGLIWLSTILGMQKAIAAGLLPFIPAEVFKVSLAAVLLPSVWTLLKR